MLNDTEAANWTRMAAHAAGLRQMVDDFIAANGGPENMAILRDKEIPGGHFYQAVLQPRGWRAALAVLRGTYRLAEVVAFLTTEEIKALQWAQQAASRQSSALAGADYM